MSFMPLNSRVGSSKEPKMHCHGRSKGLLSRIFLFNKYLYKRENCTVYIVFNYAYIYICIYEHVYLSEIQPAGSCCFTAVLSFLNSLLLRNGGVFVQCQGEPVLLLRVESQIASGASCHRRVDPCQLACDTGVGVLRGPPGKDSTDSQILWQK